MKSLPLIVLCLSYLLATAPVVAGGDRDNSDGGSSNGSGSTVGDSSLNEYVYDLYSDGSTNIDYTLDATTSSIVIDGTSITVGVTAWSDTANISNDGISGDDDEVVKYSQLNGYSYNGDYGFGLVNTNDNDAHTLDNFTGGDDFDMVLFSFSEEVTLSAASFTYLQGYDTDKQVSVVGLSDISLFENHASNEFSWADVASGVGTVVSDGHFTISSNISSHGSHGDFTSDFTELSAAKYWLVGAYNIYFDDSSTSYQGSGFKLASLSITTGGTDVVSPPNEVSEPAPIALLLTGFGLMAWRRKQIRQTV